MLLSIVQLSLRSVCGTKLFKPVGLRSLIKCEYGTKWVSRKPVAIVNEDEFFESDDEIFRDKESVSKTLRKRSRPKTHKKNEAVKKTDEIRESSTGIRFTALDADNKLISSMMIDIKTKKKRSSSGQMLLEGFRLIQDAIQAGITPKVIFFSRLIDIQSLSFPEEVQLYKIPYRTIQLWSNLTTSPGIIGIFEIPDTKVRDPPVDAIPLTIICDNIREPGNLGSIIRAAAAVGCEKLILMKGCVDIWEPKVLRSAIGAHFRLPIITFATWDEIPSLISEESAMFLADNNVAYDSQNDTINSPESSFSPSIEDNNNNMEENTNNDISANNDKLIDNNMIDQVISQTIKPTAKTKLLVKKMISQLPVESYYTLNFTEREVVLVIGGETEGVSLESCKLLRERNCTRVNVPLTNGIDSLNVGVAVGIVTFEIKRQFVTRQIDDE